MASGIEVFAHNIETVERLTPQVRDRRSGYHQSLATLQIANTMAQEHQYTKSSIMLGLGERDDEVQQALTDLRHVGCDVVTFGQYLAPTRRHKKYLPIQEYVPQTKFDYFRQLAESMGFLYVASGPLVRSSYRAGEFFMRAMIERKQPPPKKSGAVAIEHWGELAYQQAHQRQKQYLNEIILGQRPETIALCSHPPVITLGKSTPPGELSRPAPASPRGGLSRRARRQGHLPWPRPGRLLPPDQFEKSGPKHSGLALCPRSQHRAHPGPLLPERPGQPPARQPQPHGSLGGRAESGQHWSGGQTLGDLPRTSAQSLLRPLGVSGHCPLRLQPSDHDLPRGLSSGANCRENP